VDQFEEIFGQPISEDERQAFIVALNSLARRAIVVLALRADFYESAKRYPQLESALSERQIVLGAMSTRELRTAIIEPARKARLDVDNGLVAVMLRDLAPGEPVGGRTEAYDPGALPLLAHALLTTWERSRAGKLTLDEYEATGGIQAAIAESAENVYHALDSGRQETARWLFLRLVNASGDAPATRGAIQINELDDVQETSVKEVLERFVEARLITVDSDVARITHGALLTAWRRLQTWIDTSLEDLRIRHHISAAARFWEEAGCDSAALLHGRQLALVSNWATNPHNLTSLSHQEREFVESSVAIAEARKKIARRRSRRRYLTLRWQDLLHAFADGFGGVFALFGYNSPDTAPLPSFESTLADDVHHLCVSLELYKAAEGMSAGEQHR
jgi:hypothetical protein